MFPSARFDPNALSPAALTSLARRLRCAPTVTPGDAPTPLDGPEGLGVLALLIGDAARLRRLEGATPEEAAGMLSLARVFFPATRRLCRISALALTLAETEADDAPLAEAFLALAGRCAAAAGATDAARAAATPIALPAPSAETP